MFVTEATFADGDIFFRSSSYKVFFFLEANSEPRKIITSEKQICPVEHKPCYPFQGDASGLQTYSKGGTVNRYCES